MEPSKDKPKSETPPISFSLQQQQQMEQMTQQHLQSIQQMQRFQTQEDLRQITSAVEESVVQKKRKLYAIEEHDELSSNEEVLAKPSSQKKSSESTPEQTDVAYDADVDEEMSEERQGSGTEKAAATIDQKILDEKVHIYELFQPWALKTYGDQAKTKTITMRKKARILKALEGKEHSRPDSSKFRFWVKTKGFTTTRPEGFQEAPGSRKRSTPFPPDVVLSDRPSEVDLFVASTSKDFGKRIYRKVAVVEEFFDIIYNVHMELGGRSGMHAGQKRTYRIITETYAFLPREAVTRFLSICPECKKNLRPSSPAVSGVKEEQINDSSSEFEALNYSSHTESSLEAGPTAKKRRSSNTEKSSLASQFEVTVEPLSSMTVPVTPQTVMLKDNLNNQTSISTAIGKLEMPVNIPKIRVNPQLQRPITPPLPQPVNLQKAKATSTKTEATPQMPQTSHSQSSNIAYPPFSTLGFDANALKTQENLFRYYEFMHRFYGGGASNLLNISSPSSIFKPLSVLAPPAYGSNLLQTLRYPTQAINKPPLLKIPRNVSHSPSSPSTAPNTQMSSPQSSQPITKKLKISPDSLKNSKASTSSLAIPVADSTIQTSAINLSKPLHSSSNGTPPTSSTPAEEGANSSAAATTPISKNSTLAKTLGSVQPITSTPTNQVKTEVSSPPKGGTDLCIPQLRTSGPSSSSFLPPLDLERLKPITSTYLQLTRSMGLSDEDALRFDNLQMLNSIYLSKRK